MKRYNLVNKISKKMIGYVAKINKLNNILVIYKFNIVLYKRREMRKIQLNCLLKTTVVFSFYF